MFHPLNRIFNGCRLSEAQIIQQRGILHVLLLLLTLQLTGRATAMVIPDLNRVSILVESQTQESIDVAGKKALSEVLTRYTGMLDFSARDDLQVVIERYNEALLTKEFVHTDNTSKVRFSFDPGTIRRIIMQHDLPLWYPARPRALLWLVVNDGDGSRLHTQIEPLESTANHFDAFKRLGLPVVIPLGDLQDLSAISAFDIEQLSISAIRESSQRYAADVIVVARLLPKPAAESVAADASAMTAGRGLEGVVTQSLDFHLDVTLIYPEQRVSQESLVMDVNDGLEQLPNQLLAQFARRYAFLPIERQQRYRVEFTVNGIFDFEQDLVMQSAIEALATVERITLLEKTPNTSRYRVEIFGDLLKNMSLFRLQIGLIPKDTEQFAKAIDVLLRDPLSGEISADAIPVGSTVLLPEFEWYSTSSWAAGVGQP